VAADGGGDGGGANGADAGGGGEQAVDLVRSRPVVVSPSFPRPQALTPHFSLRTPPCPPPPPPTSSSTSILPRIKAALSLLTCAQRARRAGFDPPRSKVGREGGREGGREEWWEGIPAAW
jgi:hypothetical protein